ncbi:MAG: alpha/beta fold hydrolase, partial [Chloroflexi bacterium]|nr:alpha/beta fold hydrolase [Chloroflexota bacterium]
MPYVSTNGIDTYYEVHGEGPATPLVLSHGLGATSQQWVPHLLPLAETRPLILYDTRGHGKTTAPSDEKQYSLEIFAADLAGMLDAIGVKKAHIGGQSLGGMITANLAGEHLKADAIITDRPEVALMMRFADCVPIMIYDPRRRAAGVAHAGWLGTVRGVATELVRSLQKEYGCRPEELVAGIGPSIGPDHYPVRKDVVEQFKESHGDPACDHLHSFGGAVHLDLWSAN